MEKTIIATEPPALLSIKKEGPIFTVSLWDEASWVSNQMLAFVQMVPLATGNHKLLASVRCGFKKNTDDATKAQFRTSATSFLQGLFDLYLRKQLPVYYPKVKEAFDVIKTCAETMFGTEVATMQEVGWIQEDFHAWAQTQFDAIAAMFTPVEKVEK